jgi:hypothetical protein
MELWHGDLPDFLTMAQSTALADQMTRVFERLHRRPPAESERRSWHESLAAVAKVADAAPTDDIGVLVEYHLPLSERRIDVLLFGQRGEAVPNSLLIELKRWDRVDVEDEFALNVLTGDQEHVHPSQQALDYAEYLRDVHSEYSDQPFGIVPCSYCHEMTSGAVLRDARFSAVLSTSPVFLKGDEGGLAELLIREVSGGQGVRLMHQVRGGTFRPSRKVVDALTDVLSADDEWHLLDEQRKAFNGIWSAVQRLRFENKKRSAILVRGGPGTGKSVIAIQLLAEALKQSLVGAHSTGGKAFTTVLQAKFRGARDLFRWNMSLRNAPPLGLDLLLVDEAHRIRETSDTRFTPRAERGQRSQVDELLSSAKVTAFFLDEHQYMRPDEVGDSELIREAASKRQIPLKEFDLSAQFRCGGSREYVDWLDAILGFKQITGRSWSGLYDFALVGDPRELDDFVESGAGQERSSRIVAGFCWKWSEPLDDGGLVDDVIIGDWKRPWNRKRSKNKTYSPITDPYTRWATTDEGEGQVGCIYSIQGFEFDRVGVVWGSDLVWRNGEWVGQKKASKDGGLRRATGDQVTRLVKHAYRVLLTRGMRGTRLLCLDEETRAHLVQCVEEVRRRALVVA